MSAKTWLAINPDQFRLPTSNHIGKATVVSSTSPYSIPDAVTTYDDKDSGAYVLEVKYIGADEPIEIILSDNLKLMRGKNSKRLFKVQVHHGPELQGSDQSLAALTDAIERLSRDPISKIENSEVVTAVIEEIKNRLLTINFEDPKSEQK
jgi:hypothetical protein